MHITHLQHIRIYMSNSNKKRFNKVYIAGLYIILINIADLKQSELNQPLSI